MAHVNEIITSARYEILREIVKNSSVILTAIDPLMNSLQSEQKDWNLIVKDIKAYALKNFYIWDHHKNVVI